MQKKLKVMFKNLKLIKRYKKKYFCTFKNVQKRSKTFKKYLGDHSCISSQDPKELFLDSQKYRTNIYADS